MGGYGYGSEGKSEPWSGLRQVLLVRTTRELVADNPSAPIVEDHYYLTSLSPCSYKPGELLALVRRHWLIENELHHVKDRTMHEDAQRHGPGAAAIARLRSLTVGLLRSVAGATIPAKQGRLRADPRMALKLLTSKRKRKNLL